ncbi:DUF5688 family protein [Anaerovoracaceae bacterium 42-11]
MVNIDEVFESNDFATDMIASKEPEVKKHIFFKLIHDEDCGSSLRNYPHKRLENLVKIYFFEPVPRCQIKITYNHLRQMGMDLQELDVIAQQNSMKQKPAELIDLDAMFSSRETNLLESKGFLSSSLYILTNTDRTLGASSICYPGVLAQIGERLCTDFYILPSSIDEVLIFPKHIEIPAKLLGRVVRNANATVVAEGHILSDCAYEYSRERDTLTIVPGSQERNFKEKER